MSGAADGGFASFPVAAAPLAGVNFAPADRSTVSEDHSLEEFAAGDDSTDADDPGDPDGSERVDDAEDPGDNGTDDAADNADNADGVDAVEPLDPTYGHSPDGAPCAVCGGQVTRRWHDDGDYVCADCKEW